MNRLEVVGLSLQLPGRRLLDDVCLTAEAGECVAVMGPSGSGKTSLLNCIAGITTPTAGSIRIDEVDMTRLRVGARSAFRLRQIGMVFQFGELLHELSVVENVALPLRLLGVARDKAEQQAMTWLDRLGLAEHARAHPDVLSGGEVQRAGIARALAHQPRMVLADEPTGMLDETNATQVAALLVEMGKELNATVVVATHDPLVASAADRVLRLRDARLLPVAALVGAPAGGPW